MNNNSEADDFLAWLFQKTNPTVEPSGDSSQRAGSDELGAANLRETNSIDSKEGFAASSDLGESGVFSFQDTPDFEAGDISAVQDRFYALLKRRLRSEIERNPPLFPWEPEILDYDSEPAVSFVPGLAATPFWAAQLKKLNLPVAMPEAVVDQLLDQCQKVVQSSLQQGKKLVQAVDSLFPGHEDALNHLAGLVMAAPARSAGEAVNFPNRYEAATTAQQMALSLMVAREILDSLTLTVSPSQPKVSRQWQTTVGTLTLEAETPNESGTLRIRGELPCGGKLQLQGQEAEAIARRPSAGAISVELFDLKPNQVYPLEVRLALPDQPSLVFAVQTTEE